jgi:hypothetical protein
MGGKGSGRQCGWSRKPVVEDYRRLDIRRLQRDGFLISGKAFSWGWWNSKSERTADVIIAVEHDIVRLQYKTRSSSEPLQSVDEPIPIKWTFPHYGGRPWWECPGCGRRVAILYGAIYFRCRHCYRLPYGCQEENDHDRLLRRVQKLRRRLGGSLSLFDRFPDKPKGMHQKTYYRLKAKGQAVEYALNTALCGQLKGLR